MGRQYLKLKFLSFFLLLLLLLRLLLSGLYLLLSLLLSLLVVVIYLFIFNTIVICFFFYCRSMLDGLLRKLNFYFLYSYFKENSPRFGLAMREFSFDLSWFQKLIQLILCIINKHPSLLALFPLGKVLRIPLVGFLK